MKISLPIESDLEAISIGVLPCLSTACGLAPLQKLTTAELIIITLRWYVIRKGPWNYMYERHN